MGILRDKLDALKAKAGDNLKYADPEAAKAEAQDEFHEALVDHLEGDSDAAEKHHAELVSKLETEFAKLEERIDAIEKARTSQAGAADPHMTSLVDALMARMSVIETHLGIDTSK